MTATKILHEDIAPLRVSSLPSRPTAPSAFGGRGYTATQMKEAFDRLPLFLVEKFNALLDDIRASGADSLCASIPTGLNPTHTLNDLLGDIRNGNFAGYLSVGEESLLSALARQSGTLDGLCSDIESGKLARDLVLGQENLAAFYARTDETLRRVQSFVGGESDVLMYRVDCGSPADTE